MAEKSKWEKYVVRRPARFVYDKVMAKAGAEEVPKTVPIHDDWQAGDTGVNIPMSPLLVPETSSIVEYGILYADSVGKTQPHKHPDYEEIFLFFGTNPDDISDLGGEIEFWIGEGDDAEGIVFKESGAIFLPKNTGHFPMIIRNVKRPIIKVIIMPKILKRDSVPISTKGRPNLAYKS